MAFDITNAMHVSRVIDDTVRAINELDETVAQLAELETLNTVNGFATPLNGGTLPEGFNVTAAQLLAALVALAAVKAATTTAITTQRRTDLNAVKLNIGVLTGTG